MNIFLVRHAQAGDIKKNYDELSELGKFQAKELGKYFYKNHIQFDFYIRGTLNRHKETMNLIKIQLNSTNKEDIVLDSLDEISQELFKKLLFYYIDKDKFIKYLFEKLQNPHDKKESKEIYILLLKNIFKHWIKDKENPYNFLSFKNHVLKIFEYIEKYYRENYINNILIVSSGTPISIIIGDIFHFTDEESLNWMKRIYNTSLSIFSIKKKKRILWEPITINSCPHLLYEYQTLL